MNNMIYIARDKKSNKKIPEFIKKFDLMSCYKDRQETILKCEELIMSLRKKYVILNVISPQSQVVADIYDFFGNENI